jgi:TRAP-type mannitol/chloroaromatic compound transport system substrate-binding protein
MKRRDFLSKSVLGGTAAAAASVLAAPAIAQQVIEWRMVHSWPKGLPGVGVGADRLAQRIEVMSGGRLKIQVFAAGELVPALGCMDAVMDGTAEMGHDASFYHVGKHPMLAAFFAVPFGMTADEQAAWLLHGGGQALWDELNGQFGIISIPAGQTANQSFGWFRNPIDTVEQFQGLKIRMPGLGGKMVEKLGAIPTLIPGGEIFAALQSGTVDAAEFIGPVNDLPMGFYQVAKYSYGPGVQEPGGTVQLMINKTKFEELPVDLQEIIRAACHAGHEDMKVEYDIQSGRAMEVLRVEHGVEFRRLDRPILEALGKAAGEVIDELYQDGDDITRRIWDSYLAARADTMRFLRFNEQAFLNARTLDFPFPGPSAT